VYRVEGPGHRDLFFDFLFFLDDVWVPDSQVVGETGAGLGSSCSAREVGGSPSRPLSLATAASDVFYG